LIEILSESKFNSIIYNFVIIEKSVLIKSNQTNSQHMISEKKWEDGRRNVLLIK